MNLFDNIFTTIISSVILIITKNLFDKKDTKAESMEINEKIEKIDKDIASADTDDINIIKLMYNNLKELKEYYVISKRQANKTFSAAIFICFLGFIIYIFGIIATCVLDQDISLLIMISGTIIELISGLFFWMYSKTIKQLNIYHKRLSETQKYLISIQLVGKMIDDSTRYELHFIIDNILKDNNITS